MSDWVEGVFLLVQYLALVVWGLMVVLPRWSVTERLVPGWWYLFSIGSGWLLMMGYGMANTDACATFGNAFPPSVDGVARNLGIVALAPASWTHYTIIDLFLGRWIYLREPERGVVLSGILVLVYAAGPAGLLAWLGWNALRRTRSGPEAGPA